ncbi:C2 domain-containing protein 3 [Myripristis murdjan]|uniref:C2 domain-containing protein 3 n=1 Tax=Myripristis murdjan TaxID=586833 RepID=UPI0011762004|nr:C2 domain-containing protein 3 [Myripristis murdjan]
MKNKQLRSAKAGSSKRKVPSDVSPSTSLPPLVEGPLRCFLRVTVSRVLWTVHKPPPATFLRLRWWGESSDGTHFYPRDGSQMSQKTVKTTARFPIRCGPKQFTSYLTDMGCLVLEVLTKLDHLPIARAQVAGISCLSLSHAISGFYTLVSPTSEKMGELQVSLTLEPLTEAYDSSSSVHTTDISIEVPPVTTLMVPSQPRRLSVGSGSSSGNTPRGKDHLYFQSAQVDKGKEESLEKHLNPSRKEASDGHTTNDVLSVILERGSKLRNAMVVSALKCDLDSAPALKDTPLPLPKDNILQSSKSSSPPCGLLLQNILHADSSLQPSHHVDRLSPDCPADMENRAVELLLGSLNTSALPLWDGEGSPPESLSGHSSVCGDSELNDPQYDHSLLENLFYKTPMSDIRRDDVEVNAGKAVSCGTSQQKKSSQGGAEKHLGHSGPKNIGDPKSQHQQTPDDNDTLSRLSTEQLAVLAGIRLARVTIHSLTVPAGSTSPRKTSSKGKPPRPQISNKCSYFVEYVFPVAGPSRHERNQAVAGKVTRAVSSKVTGGVVKFQQHSAFPVHFSGATVKHWWQTDLIFKIYSRKSNQKKPVLVGKAVHPLRCLLQREQLSQCVVLPVQSVEGNSETQDVGPLKVSLELVADSQDFSSAKGRLAGHATSPSHITLSPQREPSCTPQHVGTGREELPAESGGDSRLDVYSIQRTSRRASPHHSPHAFPPKSWRQQEEEDSGVLLHALLMVPDGKSFNCGPMQAPNVYLNCKLFWTDETARSVISWGQANPSFSFVQVTPVALTTKLLERMKNNVMVIEVWQRTGSSGQDRLLGLVKLPLHQFYMSFRDPKITHLLLQAQYPVLGVDCYMPVIDVFSGSCKGNLRVVLAMGQAEQILALQRTRDEEYGSVSHLVRPVHLLDQQPQSQTKASTTQEEPMREHLFVIRVEKVKGLMPLQSTVWGEADCYIQYTFPCQEDNTAENLDPNLVESSVNLKQFRTATALCVPDPIFGHSETHVLLAPEGVPVQRLLLSSLSSQGLASGGGVQFEVWCRYYYPNVRDQLVAKGILPLSKLCAMVTMQRQQPNDFQLFSLPLVPRTDSPTGHQPQPSGLLDVCIQYKHRPLRPEGQIGRGLAARVVTLVVQLHRASGLQAAARLLSEQDERFQYYADVGVNVYVTVQLSFLPETERRCTRVAAQTFCPEFDHYMEIPCDLQVQRSSGETCSLAELLEEASAVFTVWNRESRKVRDSSKSKDTMLGTVKIPLANLIRKKTGISGWFGVSVPQDLGSSHDHHIIVGGLEISINFAHHADKDRVIKAAQGLGWEMDQRDYERRDDEEVWEESMRTVSLTFSMPRAWLPVHCLLLPGHSELQRSTYCYFRYKFYDQEAFCSHLKHPSIEEAGEEGQATVAFPGPRTVKLRSSQPLMWYLREERLEVQVWVAFRKDKTRRPHDTDRLVGSAFIDVSSLAKTPKHKLTLSGVYPLFRRTAADLRGAALRVHITLTAGGEVSAGVDRHVDTDIEGELLSEEEEAADQGSLPTTPSKQPGTQSKQQNKFSLSSDHQTVQHTAFSVEESFPVTITVDRAMHLSLKGCPLADRSGVMPSCCVSYVTADSAEPVSTAVIANTDCPVWDHHQECRLPKQLLVDPQQSLVFKVWHKGDMERVIGFASVDLSPLLSGFQSVCGWYNITDFSSQCQGQLKVSISPLKGVQELRGQRKSVNEESSKNSSALFQAFPVSYHTAATYSSFPSHISRYPEQKISSPEHMDRLFSERVSESDRHCEHMDNVRLYHQSLQEQATAHPACSSSAGDINPSSSVLLSALRKNLNELDNIQKYFSRKLSTPTFPSVSEQVCQAKPEERRDSETHTSQLLLKSSQLVGEVNSLISGLQGQRLQTTASNPPSSFGVGDDNHRPVTPEALTERIPSPHRPSDSPQQNMSPLSSPLPNMSEGHTDSETEEAEERRCLHRTAESEDEDGDFRKDEEVDDADSDEDFEEVVVKPRHLNEVTSLTDKTSPWTSILSEPDLGSLESPELPGELTGRSPDLTHEEEAMTQLNSQTANLQGQGHRGEESCNRLEESEYIDSDKSNESADDSDKERDGERTLQALEEDQTKQPTTATKESGDSTAHSENKSPTLSANAQNTTGAFDTSGSPHSQDTQPQPSVPVEVPNFFLPSHQLEASMRALRLAPVFSQPSSDPGPVTHSIPHRRAPRQRPNITTPSKKKETARIAKIFAAHFNEDH